MNNNVSMRWPKCAVTWRVDQSALRTCAVGFVVLLAACQPKRELVELQPLVACPVVDGSLFDAGALPDGLPSDPAEAVLTLYRCCVEARRALELIRKQLEVGR